MTKTKIRLSGHTTPTFLNSCNWVELRNGHPALDRACTLQVCYSLQACHAAVHVVAKSQAWLCNWVTPTAPAAAPSHFTQWPAPKLWVWPHPSIGSLPTHSDKRKSYPVGFGRRQDLALPLSTAILSHCINLAKLERRCPWTSLWVWGSAGQNRPYMWDLEDGREAAAMFLGSEGHTGPQAPWRLAQAASNLLVICICKGSPWLLQILCVFWSRARRVCSSVVKHSSFSHRSPSAPRLEKVRDRHTSNLSSFSPKSSFPFQASFRLTLGSTPDTVATAWTIS